MFAFTTLQLPIPYVNQDMLCSFCLIMHDLILCHLLLRLTANLDLNDFWQNGCIIPCNIPNASENHILFLTVPSSGYSWRAKSQILVPSRDILVKIKNDTKIRCKSQKDCSMANKAQAFYHRLLKKMPLKGFMREKPLLQRCCRTFIILLSSYPVYAESLKNCLGISNIDPRKNQN